MRVEIEFDTDSPAFAASLDRQAAYLVREVANAINVGDRQGRLYDDSSRDLSIGTWMVHG